MTQVATILGLCAVALFVLSYQMKRRRTIIAVNALSRVLYIAQYLLLGAFEGAHLDITALFVSILCGTADSRLVKKHFVLTVILANAAVIGVGLLSYRSPLSLLPIFGVIFETLALWLKRERHIRLASLLGAPFWLAYNLQCGAFGSAIGNVITLVSLSIAILRYDMIHKAKKDDLQAEDPL